MIDIVAIVRFAFAQSQPDPPTSPAPSAGLDPNKTVTSEDGQCAVFNKEELTWVRGSNLTHADPDATGCTYKGNAPREWVRTEALWKGGRKPTIDLRYYHDSDDITKC